MNRLLKGMTAFCVAFVLSGNVIPVHAEGNATAGSATELSLNAWSYDNLTADKKESWHKVTIPSDGYLTVNWEASFHNCSFSVYNDNQTRTYYDSWIIDNGTDSEKFALNAGTYYIRFSDTKGSYKVQTVFEAANNNEGHDNTSFSTALDLSSGQNVTGLLTEDNHDDYYVFNMPSAGTVSLAYAAVSGMSDGNEVILYGSDQKTEFYHGTDTSINRDISLNAGTYYVRVHSNGTGSYTLRTGQNNITMYRAYNPNSGEHFYTGNTKEFNYIVSLGWRNEGTGWVAPQSSNTPVYRLYNKNGGEHHYTMSEKEKNALVAAGWKDEGIGWYSDDAKSVPLYRQYNPNAFANNHNYTTSEKEKNYLISLGWRDEGIGWYGVSAQ